MFAVHTPPLGRPRDPRIDEAVLAATRELLAEVGYKRLSMGLVARRAGVHRPAIYRRWSSKPHLVCEAVYPAPPVAPAVPAPLPVATGAATDTVACPNSRCAAGSIEPSSGSPS